MYRRHLSLSLNPDLPTAPVWRWHVHPPSVRSFRRRTKKNGAEGFSDALCPSSPCVSLFQEWDPGYARLNRDAAVRAGALRQGRFSAFSTIDWNPGQTSALLPHVRSDVGKHIVRQACRNGHPLHRRPFLASAPGEIAGVRRQRTSARSRRCAMHAGPAVIQRLRDHRSTDQVSSMAQAGNGSDHSTRWTGGGNP